GNMTFINTGGLSIDFPATESGMIYFAATEDCAIHRCSVSYSEQSYETYYGHTGPIYKVRCNPFWHPIECPIFMTCSYDWTVRIWKTKEINEKLVCHEMSNKE
ncbi:MAG: WD40 repeat domain-containing protein, partial [bacterium]